MPPSRPVLGFPTMIVMTMMMVTVCNSARPFEYSFPRTRTPMEAALNPTWRNLNNAMQRAVITQMSDPRFLKSLRVRKNLQTEKDGYPFPCNISLGRSPEPPTSVHRLRPGDVNVIAAMGDSLTAGNGAMALNIIQITNENRGRSWCGGGEGTWRQYLTVPNIMKEFNPALYGYSLKDSRAYQRASVFNVAEINSMSQDLAWQATNLVKRMKSDPKVDLKNDWKVITILVGSNDFCSDMCWRKDPESLPDQHREDLREALRILKKNLPRTFVNLPSSPDLSRILPAMKKTSTFCELLRRVACSCLYGESFRPQRRRMEKIIERYIQAEFETAEDPEFQTDDFTVVLQPFTYNLKFPLKNPGETDFSYMAPDCFHFSQRGYARAANALWNNMMEPVGHKTTTWLESFEKFMCPTKESPYLYTNQNSARKVDDDRSKLVTSENLESATVS